MRAGRFWFLIVTTVVIVVVKREVLVLANGDFVTAAIQRHPWLHNQPSFVLVPVNIKATHDAPAKHHAIDQVPFVIKVRLLLYQVANGELLSVEVIIPLKGIRRTYTAFRIFVWLHLSFLSLLSKVLKYDLNYLSMPHARVVTLAGFL